ncbi:ankyrin repeat and SOCS box protein 3 isoform X2 [Mugil cephalus]|uniref:ankyrin repeat and SOCS box protein 3 isoform X2 n=1 Tax=Mugil cephalus TaxID=48193 RepID=UPI001FB710B8|nr:ankyrin repeat and SOCS box protein 3 isoform X2 [Mugil cephalus]
MDFTECYSDSVSGLSSAARSGSRKRLRRLLRTGCSPETRDNRGWTALHEAAAAGRQDCVRDILSAVRARSSRRLSVLVNSLTHEGESAFYLAAQRGHLDVLRLLLDAGTDMNQLTNDLSCPLYAAVDSGHQAVVDFLVREGAEVNRVHTASCWTCLHQAVYKGLGDMVRVLVGVSDLEAVDDHRMSPLFVAAQYGRTECLEILVDAGADVNSQAADLASPLLIASQEGHRACVDVLLDHGADPNTVCSLEWPQLAVHSAAQFGHVGILRRLVAVTDRHCDRGEDMVSPLYVAVHSAQTLSVETLLGDGFSPDAQDCTSSLGFSSPLSLALSQPPSKPSRDSVSLLLAAGARLTEEEWLRVVGPDKTELLQLILDHRWIPGPGALSSDGPRTQREGRTALRLQEVRGLLCVALDQVQSAASWLPVLLEAGLEPSLLLQPHMLDQADSEVLNFLLEFVNWSTLAPALRRVLDRRRSENTWRPRPHFDAVPRLSHLCRLQVRATLGSDLLIRTSVVQQLHVPSPLHRFLRFRDVLEEAPCRPPDPDSHHTQGHEHRHVL